MLWHVRRGLYVKGPISDDKLRSLIIVLADELKTLSGCEPQVETAFPWRCVRAGIVHHNFVFDRAEISAGESFDHVQLLGRGHSEIVDPDTLVETNRVHNQCVTVPMPDRMPAVTRR